MSMDEIAEKMRLNVQLDTVLKMTLSVQSQISLLKNKKEIEESVCIINWCLISPGMVQMLSMMCNFEKSQYASMEIHLILILSDTH